MEDTSVFTSVALPIAVAVIMVSLGLELTRGDFRRVFAYPRGVLIGLANLIVIAPLLAFVIADVFGLAATLAIGLVLLGASPGGALAPYLRFSSAPFWSWQRVGRLPLRPFAALRLQRRDPDDRSRVLGEPGPARAG